jgi:hypothetical protein
MRRKCGVVDVVASTKAKCDCDSGRLGARPTMFTDPAPASAGPNDGLCGSDYQLLILGRLRSADNDPAKLITEPLAQAVRPSIRQNWNEVQTHRYCQSHRSDRWP